ncbi:hypothetical protein [Agromyces archimandritae]|uniref:hypothetical protein n=1 Tax=Agromyces archimandritae TaxID=2781962 RepID=UPI001FCFE631|nr:hypothetical protein [Agromyces archimandritae]
MRSHSRRIAQTLTGSLLRARTALAARLSPASERGDVPGWVLITLMTAGLVLLIWGLAGPALEKVFEDAISRVSGI